MPPTDDSRSKKRLVFDASIIARVHSWLACTAFASALCIGCLLHYKKIVKNGVAGYPQEWFPSVSATIGDWYPERNIFQVLIALTAGPRFALVILLYYLQRSQNSSLPTVVFISGLIRTISCGGWVYITSSDDHDVHDVLMIAYIVCDLPWMLGGIACTQNTVVRRKRRMIATGFFASIVPLIYFFIQHKVHRVPGAYTRYAFFEWGLIIFDVLFDSVAEQDLREADLQISLGPSLHSGAEIDPMAKSEPKIDNTSATTLKEKLLIPPSPPSLLDLPALAQHRPILSFMSDLYLSYIFWSLFTSLIPTLFYFSVWELGIAGQELALLATLSPAFLTVPSVLSWVRSRGGSSALQLLSLSGLAAYALNSPLHRFFVVTFANIIAVMGQVVIWAGLTDGHGVGYQSTITALGLMVSSLSKHANHSNNPIWPLINESSGGYNKTGLVVAVLALYELSTRPVEQTPSEASKDTNQGNTGVYSMAKEHWFVGALPLGSLVFTFHSLLSDPSTLLAWSWTGYENNAPRGPMPHLHGSITLIAQSLGLLIALTMLSLSPTSINYLSHPVWFTFGLASSYIMLQYRNWIGYLGGLGVAVFTMAVAPIVFQRAALSGLTARTYFTAFLVYCLLVLASVWTVAYAFVPGGPYLRERTDLVVLAQMMCLSLAFQWPGSAPRTLAIEVPARLRNYARTTLALICVTAVFVSQYRRPSISPVPYKSGPRIFNAGIWTVHFGMDNTGRDSQRLIKNVVRDLELDIIGLLETDLHRVVYGNRDLTRVIVEELGYYVDLGPGPNSHTWGAALLSKFPIISSKHHLLPSPRGELAPAIEAVLDVFGTEVTVVVSHNGQEEDPLDRELQSRELARIMAAAHPRPVIFLGYVVTKPHAKEPAPYEIMVRDGQVHDIDKDDQDRWCEYIFYRNLYRTAYARVSRGVVTDTELQIGQFALPKYGFGVVNETEEARYLRAFKEELPQRHWFPMSYYGDQNKGGVNGHYYHVFGTPLYYKIPKDAVL
ncbi:Calcofluor white hypersensitive protein [Pleurotus pulmonarius]